MDAKRLEEFKKKYPHMNHWHHFFKAWAPREEIVNPKQPPYFEEPSGQLRFNYRHKKVIRRRLA